MELSGEQMPCSFSLNSSPDPVRSQIKYVAESLSEFCNVIGGCTTIDQSTKDSDVPGNGKFSVSVMKLNQKLD